MSITSQNWGKKRIGSSEVHTFMVTWFLTRVSRLFSEGKNSLFSKLLFDSGWETWETWVWSLGWEDPLEKEMATHSSILAWEIRGQRNLVGYSQLDCKKHDLANKQQKSMCPRRKLNIYFRPYAQVNSKWIKYLNVRTKTIKLSEGNIGTNLCDLEFGNGFLDMTPKALTIEEKISRTLSKL